MRVVPKPDKSTPLLEPDGRTVSQAWYEWFGYLHALNLPAFAKTAPAVGQVPVWNDTLKIYEPGAN